MMDSKSWKLVLIFFGFLPLAKLNVDAIQLEFLPVVKSFHPDGLITIHLSVDHVLPLLYLDVPDVQYFVYLFERLLLLFLLLTQHLLRPSLSAQLHSHYTFNFLFFRGRWFSRIPLHYFGWVCPQNGVQSYLRLSGLGGNQAINAVILFPFGHIQQLKNVVILKIL